MESEYRVGTMAKRAGYAVLALCLLILLTGTAFPSSDSIGAAGKAGDSQKGELSRNFDRAVPALAFGCPDLAYTDSFKAKELGYVNSTGFAEAVQAVASGKSTYSPHEIPAGWQAAAAE